MGDWLAQSPTRINKSPNLVFAKFGFFCACCKILIYPYWVSWHINDMLMNIRTHNFWLVICLSFACALALPMQSLHACVSAAVSKSAIADEPHSGAMHHTHGMVNAHLQHKMMTSGEQKADALADEPPCHSSSVASGVASSVDNGAPSSEHLPSNNNHTCPDYCSQGEYCSSTIAIGLLSDLVLDWPISHDQLAAALAYLPSLASQPDSPPPKS